MILGRRNKSPLPPSILLSLLFSKPLHSSLPKNKKKDGARKDLLTLIAKSDKNLLKNKRKNKRKRKRKRREQVVNSYDL